MPRRNLNRERIKTQHDLSQLQAAIRDKDPRADALCRRLLRTIADSGSRTLVAKLIGHIADWYST